MRIIDPGIAAIVIGKINRAKELGIKLELASDSHLEPVHTELRQALTAVIGNLLDNALESLAAHLRDSPYVSVRIMQRHPNITVEVVDNGPGIPEDLLDQIFEFGFSTKAEKNRGLGLSIIHNIAGSHIGNVQVSSTPGQITSFIVTLTDTQHQKEG
ncbi:MAG: GHKL domain-containing protein [Peptococcaceae bacterium]|nr:GHKL domain-containing protein [Peptococcaceae bacterium]